jgi:hypothetical protein
MKVCPGAFIRAGIAGATLPPREITGLMLLNLNKTAGRFHSLVSRHGSAFNPRLIPGFSQQAAPAFQPAPAQSKACGYHISPFACDLG